MEVGRGDPKTPEATALLEASHALMQSLFPAESNHYLSIDELTRPNIRFFIATDDGAAVGCGALAVMDGYGEVKSMYVAPDARGAGAGAALLCAIEAEARAAALPTLKLETGDSLTAAHRLYERGGFSFCGPFGEYAEGPHSVFMEKLLSAA